jgi:hypothetical protein
MIIYTTSFINNYYQSLENKTLDSSLLDCLNTILNTVNNDISLNIIDNDNDLRFKKVKPKTKSSDNYYRHSNVIYNNNNNKTSLKKKEETRTKIELVKSTIKSILNKLSPTNYAKLEQELITMYIQLLTNCIESNNNEDIEYINNYIINYIIYNNVSYSTIYINILFSLISVYQNNNYKLETIHLYNLLQTHYNDFLIFDNIIKYNNNGASVNTNTNTGVTNDNCDEFAINKNNDKYKCFIIFIINFYKKLIVTLEFVEPEKKVFYNDFFINHDSISLLFIDFNKFFIKNLELENNKPYCEVIQEFILILYNELLKDSKYIKLLDCDSKIIDAIKLILLNHVNYPSFKNKIKFKLMNIRDKYDAIFKK